MRRASRTQLGREGNAAPGRLGHVLRRPMPTPGASNGLSTWFASVANEHRKLAEGWKRALTPEPHGAQPQGQELDDDLAGVWAHEHVSAEYADYGCGAGEVIQGPLVVSQPSPHTHFSPPPQRSPSATHRTPAPVYATLLRHASDNSSSQSSSSPSPVPHITSVHRSPLPHPSSTLHDIPEYGEPGDFPDGYFEDLHPADRAAAAASRKRSKGSVKPHSGLEAQDAADYEARLAAGEARDALAAANRSGQSSDDEDAGGSVELSQAIAQSTQRAKDQLAKRKQAKRGQSSSTPDAGRTSPAEARGMPDAGHVMSTADTGDQAMDAPAGLGALLLAAQVLAACSLGGDADAFGVGALSTSNALAGLDAAVLDLPNRFMGMSEPPAWDGISLAVALLNQQEQARQQQQKQAAAQQASSSLTSLIDQTEVQFSEELYRHSPLLELTLGLPLLCREEAPHHQLLAANAEGEARVEEEDVMLYRVLGLPVGPPAVDPEAVAQLRGSHAACRQP